MGELSRKLLTDSLLFELLDYASALEFLQGTQDLQLAAELGKTLLERNKELETALKQHQNVIEDQAQEIEYLTKQTVALREVSDSRLQIYEKLEISIQDLERANHRLVLDNSTGKKQIKSLTATIESLENKCEELQTTIDDLRLELDATKRRQAARDDLQSPCSSAGLGNRLMLRHVDRYEEEEVPKRPPSPDTTQKSDTHTQPNSVCSPASGPHPQSVVSAADPEDPGTVESDSSLEQVSQLLAKVRESKTQASRYERRITELEEQLASIVQQNQALENQVFQLHHRGDDDMKSMYDELSTLEEVRKGQMCSRCLRNVDRSSDLPEDDDSSVLDELMRSPGKSQLRSSFYTEVQDYPSNQSSPAPLASKDTTSNLYRNLVEKYESLLDVHRQSATATSKPPKREDEFNSAVKDTDEESGHGDSLKNDANKASGKAFSHTPTDFSEAETSSSGFSDETSNKATQTEDRLGSFLCAIADGADCKISIYDEASPIASRFRNQPEYQQLFKEIFTVLKNSAETKPAELAKIEDFTPIKKAHPDVERLEFTPEILDDDSQSVVSSTMSELSVSHNEPTTIIENLIQSQNQPIPDASEAAEERKPEERVLKPLVRQPLEYISVEVRKRSASRRKNKHQDRSDSPMTHIIGSPKINYTSRPNSARKRRDLRNAQENETAGAWNGSTVQFWASNRNLASPTPSQGSGKFEFKPSAASQELNKLKKLDLSYAEVVRRQDNNKKSNRQRRNNK